MADRHARGGTRALVVTTPGVPGEIVDDADADVIGVGELEIEIRASSLNYKDALAVTAKAPVVRRFPLVCGIDLAGVVVASTNEAFPVGSEVLAVGAGLGEEHSGGFATRAQLDAAWCVALPTGLGATDAMALGTAGFTAMLAVLALEREGVAPGELPVLVTGASGGVGSLATMVLSALGYRVVASTGRLDERDYLEAIGATEVIGRDDVLGAGGALAPPRFGAAIDVVGGPTLAAVLSQLAPNGAVAVCGLAGGAELSTTVYPLILRGVAVAGVNSTRPRPGERETAWARLAEIELVPKLATIARVEPLSAVPALSGEMLEGKIRGRVVVDVAS